jgi:hypothetical protein
MTAIDFLQPANINFHNFHRVIVLESDAGLKKKNYHRVIVTGLSTRSESAWRPFRRFFSFKKSRSKRVKNNMSMEVENDVVAPRVSKQKECCVRGNYSTILRPFDGELVLSRLNTSKYLCGVHEKANNEK